MTSGNHMDPVRAYLGDNIDKYITHPYASRESCASLLCPHY
jgi:hypothetical protein